MENQLNLIEMSNSKPETSNKENRNKKFWTDEEKEKSISLYGCEILLEKSTPEDLKNKNLPNDTYIVSYCDNGVFCCDLVRSTKKSNIFDMYWDKVRTDLINIEYGYGTVNPKNWGYQAPKNKKRK